MPLTLHLRRSPGAAYAWLSAPGAAALSLLFLKEVAPVTDLPALIWLAGPDGERLDQAMACAHHDGVLVTCHGGQAVRSRIEEVLQAQGFVATQPPMAGLNRLQRETMALLPFAQGAAAVSLLLDAANSTTLRDLSADSVPRMLEATRAATWLFEPPRIQLWGPVNAGKSSLLNALCGRTLAAIGDEPGLTRDTIEGRCEHAGFVLRIFDAPGTWAGGSELDQAAQELALHWRDQADTVLTISRAPRLAELAGKAIAYDSHNADSVHRLKDLLVDHFFGKLRRLPVAARFALHPELRADLSKLNLADVQTKWLA